MSYEERRFLLPPLTPAIKHLLIVNAAVFVLNLVLLGRLSAPPPSGGAGGFWLAFSWSQMLDGYGLGVLRLISYQFTHSFDDPWHCLWNMFVLYWAGVMAEPKLGYRGTWKVYMVGGIAGALLHLGIAAMRGYQDIPLVGASGACYALLVYAAMRLPMTMIYGVLPLWILAAALVFAGVYATFIELVRGFPGGVAHGAHVGGALLGFLAFRYSWFIDWADHADLERPGFLKGVWLNLQKKRAEARQQQAHDKQLQMDEILDKVKREGLGALSPAERRFLEQMSKQARKGE